MRRFLAFGREEEARVYRLLDSALRRLLGHGPLHLLDAGAVFFFLHMLLLISLITRNENMLRISMDNLMNVLKPSPLFLAPCRRSRERKIAELVLHVKCVQTFMWEIDNLNLLRGVGRLLDKGSTGVPLSRLKDEIFLLLIAPWCLGRAVLFTVADCSVRQDPLIGND